MFIVPVLYKSRATELQQLWIFLERNGTHLIELTATAENAIDAAKEFLTTNEMTGVGQPIIVGDLVFVEIDPASKDMASFYTWREVPPGTIPSKEVWRSFLWLSSKENVDPFGVNRLLDSISLAEPSHSAFSVLTAYRQAVTQP